MTSAIRYDIVRASSRAELVEEVRDRIAWGWAPQGGVSVIKPPWPKVAALWWAQAMVKN